jgi:hypothetical protein
MSECMAGSLVGKLSCSVRNSVHVIGGFLS